MPDPEADVRRLLADARVTDPIPPPVAARLDDVLNGLVAERQQAHRAAPPQTPPLAPVVPINRRRSETLGWLAAAAAVVVLGGFGSQVLFNGSDSNQASSSSDAAPRAEAPTAFAPGDSAKQPESARPAEITQQSLRAVADRLYAQARNGGSSGQVPTGCATPRSGVDPIPVQVGGSDAVLVRQQVGTGTAYAVFDCAAGPALLQTANWPN